MDQKQDPAFPSTWAALDGREQRHYYGMSLRDYFAAKVTQAIIGREYVSLKEAEVALVAYKMADAMLEARK